MLHQRFLKNLIKPYKTRLPLGLIFWLFVLALILRLFLAYIYNTYGPSYVFLDELSYKSTADRLWRYWHSASFPELFDYKKYAFQGFGGRNFGYNIVYALIAGLFGEFGARVANSFFVCLAAYFTYLMADEISNRKVAILAYILVLFYPSAILYSVTLHKEAFVIFSIALFMLSLTKMFRKISIKWLLISIFSFFCIFISRLYIPLLILLATSLLLIWHSRRNIFSWLVALILIVLIFYYLPDIIKESIQLNSLLSWRRKAVLSVASYWGSYRRLPLPTSFTALVFYSFQPLPFNFTSIWFVPINLGSLVWYMMFPFFLLGLSNCLKIKELRLIAITLVFIVSFYVFIYVTGTEYRHRDQMISLLAIISAVGYYRFKSLSYYNKMVFLSIPCALIPVLGFYKLWVLLS
ncbi:hypothetical protein DBT_1983 [Dissulfuribacter thermophilus]|uniref:Uncharacterized protein n=1 Tax=Dissulfuribacter thermophilus TaxID=1156395 RepID=A0A1B9F408_9BACT|nr:hypothetical protein DBT_1983 [Dissulfuribacter thermophilus]